VYVESTINILRSTFANGGFYPGIEVISPASEPSELTFNVIGNTVTGHGQPDNVSGIHLSATGGGALRFNVFNNSVWDVGQGAPGTTNSGIFLYARDSGDADFNVVGNTLHAITQDGIKVDNQQNAPNELSLDVFDNVIAGTTESAVDVTAEEPATFSARGGHNDFVSNGEKNHTLGHSLGTNLSVAPRFVDAATGDLALTSTSPLIDEGVTCSPGGVAGPDAAGNNRRSRSSVDIGAFEFGAGAPGLVLLGKGGDDTLTGAGGNDILCGDNGDDSLHGRGGNDFLDGGKDNDRLFGGPGDDALCANDGSGGDHLSGGTGRDSYRADPGDGTTSVERLGTCVT
jgi:Ca2+-binding RTX toxin-like protein